MKATNILFMLSLVLASSLASHAQVGIGTSSPNATAALDITSSNTGLLPPRMTATQRNAINSPAQGLMVYCTDCGANGEAQIYNGTAWVNVVGGSAAAPFVCGDNVTFTYGGSIVTYGTVSKSYGGSVGTKCWLDRNLGATQVATSSTHTASYGDLYQWGRGADGHQIRTSTTTITLSTTDQPGHGNFITTSGSPNDWRSGQNVNLWQGVNGVNNPCPTGYRIPTEAEWQAERSTWSSNNATSAIASPLKLPMAGSRLNNGTLSQVNTRGRYWSSTVSGTISRRLYFDTGGSNITSEERAEGSSVRCLKD